MIKVEKDFLAVPESLKNGGKYNVEDVKAALIEVYNKKCCYCESAHIKGEVEHFRPKSESWYPWLKNEWENLLWSCHDCNNIKGVKLPVEEKLAVAPNISAECDTKETLVMLNPEKDNPKGLFEFDKTGKLSSANAKAQKTIEICKLDRENLNWKRKRVLDDFKGRLYAAIKKGDRDRINEEVDWFVSGVKNDKELDFIAFRKYILKNWLKEMLTR